MSAKERKITKTKELFTKIERVNSKNKELDAENNFLKEQLEKYKEENRFLQEELGNANNSLNKSIDPTDFNEEKKINTIRKNRSFKNSLQVTHNFAKQQLIPKEIKVNNIVANNIKRINRNQENPEESDKDEFGTNHDSTIIESEVIQKQRGNEKNK